jgi:hypothetical protein
VLCPPRLIQRQLERSTDRDGRVLHYIERTSRRPWVKVHSKHTIPPFEEKTATFEVKIMQGRPDKYLRRLK